MLVFGSGTRRPDERISSNCRMVVLVEAELELVVVGDTPGPRGLGDTNAAVGAAIKASERTASRKDTMVDAF